MNFFGDNLIIFAKPIIFAAFSRFKGKDNEEDCIQICSSYNLGIHIPHDLVVDRFLPFS